LGPAREEKRRKAGKKDKGRSDEGAYPILAGVAAGCRVQEGFEGSLIGSLPARSQRERENVKPREHGAEISKETKAYGPSPAVAPSLPPLPVVISFPLWGGGECAWRSGSRGSRAPLIKCAFMRMLSCADIARNAISHHP